MLQVQQFVCKHHTRAASGPNPVSTKTPQNFMIQDRTPLIPGDFLMGIIAAFFFRFQRTVLEILVGTKLLHLST